MNPPPQLDPVIHPPTRLSICALLAAGAGEVEFATVRDAVGVSDSVLSKQARALEEAGYVVIRKGAVGRRARTWLRLSPLGAQAFRNHVAALQQMVQIASPSKGAHRSNNASGPVPTSREK